MLAAAPGDYGKPRPCVVVQSDLFNETHPSISVCPITTELRETPIIRIGLDPGLGNGLRARSQVMVDKVTTLRRERVRETIGRIDAETAQRLDRAIAVFFGLV